MYLSIIFSDLTHSTRSQERIWLALYVVWQFCVLLSVSHLIISFYFSFSWRLFYPFWNQMAIRGPAEGTIFSTKSKINMKSGLLCFAFERKWKDIKKHEKCPNNIFNEQNILKTLGHNGEFEQLRKATPKSSSEFGVVKVNILFCACITCWDCFYLNLRFPSKGTIISIAKSFLFSSVSISGGFTISTPRWKQMGRCSGSVYTLIQSGELANLGKQLAVK